MTYTWASIAGQTAFNDFFLGYVVLFALSLFTLIGATATTDPEVIYRELSGQLSKTLYSGFLALVAIGLSLLWLSEIVPAIISGATPPIVEAFGERGMHTYVLDLGVVVPSLAIAAVWLWRDCSWGYVFAGVLLVMAAILAPLLTAITVVDVQDNLVYVPLPMLVGTILPPVVAAGFAIKYLLALGGKPTADREVDESGVDA